MSRLNSQQIKVLSGLIGSTRESAGGYRDAARGTMSPHFKSHFERCAMVRDQATAQLLWELRSLGSGLEEENDIAASAQCLSRNLESAPRGRSRSVVDDIEAGEQSVKADFELALGYEYLSPRVRGVIDRLYDRIKADYDQMHNIKRDRQKRLSCDGPVDAE